MAIQQKSKYSNEQLETLMQDLYVALEKNKAPADLSLMALGNLVTNILHSSAKDEFQRERLTEAFTTTLKNALKSTK